MPVLYNYVLKKFTFKKNFDFCSNKEKEFDSASWISYYCAITVKDFLKKIESNYHILCFSFLYILKYPKWINSY